MPLANTISSVSVRSGKLHSAPVAEAGVQEPRREERRKRNETFCVTWSECCNICIAVGIRG